MGSCLKALFRHEKCIKTPFSSATVVTKLNVGVGSVAKTTSMAGKQQSGQSREYDELDGIDYDYEHRFINRDDGLNQTHERGSLEDSSDLPKSIIVANVSLCVFEDDASKETFENVFREYESDVTFNYLKSFRRARVNFLSPHSALQARVNLHEKELLGGCIKCYFVQVATPSDTDSDTHLHPPLPDKMFLISPPASPPVDWAPVDEAEPIINHDLARALEELSHLGPGSTHELHPASSEQPGVVVHICEDPVGYRDKAYLKYIQTRRPPKT